LDGDYFLVARIVDHIGVIYILILRWELES